MARPQCLDSLAVSANERTYVSRETPVHRSWLRNRLARDSPRAVAKKIIAADALRAAMPALAIDTSQRFGRLPVGCDENARRRSWAKRLSGSRQRIDGKPTPKLRELNQLASALISFLVNARFLL